MFKRQHKIQLAIPEPYETLHSLRNSVIANKEVVETLSGQRGNILDAAVTWGDLLDIGLIKKDQLPNE